MIKIEEFEVVGWRHAIRGARNPLNSWNRSDTAYSPLKLGPNDYKLLNRLCKAGSDHRKFMRMIVVYVDITAPLYWWKEFDTYKVGTVGNSCSTMHKIHDKEFDMSDCSTEHLFEPSKKRLQMVLDDLNIYRKMYLEHKDKEIWWQLIQMLPSSYNQKRTEMLNYEVLRNMYHARKNHKLDEWHTFCEWVKSLPYSELITGEEEEK